VIDKIGNCYSLFTLTIACFVDRYAQAITCLPSVFQIRILLGCANDSFAPDARSVGFKVLPQELPTIRSLFPSAKPQVSTLIPDAHSPSSGDCCTGEELMPACWGRSNVRPAGPVRENFGEVVLIEIANRFCAKEELDRCAATETISSP
jgi:hypothetical protein